MDKLNATRAEWVDAAERAANASLGRLMATRDEVAAHQTDALRSVVATARERSPWHRSRLEKVDVDALTVDDLLACRR